MFRLHENNYSLIVVISLKFVFDDSVLDIGGLQSFSFKRLLDASQVTLGPNKLPKQ